MNRAKILHALPLLVDPGRIAEGEAGVKFFAGIRTERARPFLSKIHAHCPLTRIAIVGDAGAVDTFRQSQPMSLYQPPGPAGRWLRLSTGITGAWHTIKAPASQLGN